ncbi:unnamed protein product, partial [Staurois parvus]
SALHPLFLCSHQPSGQQSHQPSWQQSHQHSWQQSPQHSWQQSHQLPGSNLISFTHLQLWLLRDAFTPGCHQILSSHSPLFTMLQYMASLSPFCHNSVCKTPPLH